MCRTRQVVPVEVGKGKKTETRFPSFTVGYHHFPEDGGLLDQPHHLMLLFALFQEGERRAIPDMLR